MLKESQVKLIKKCGLVVAVTAISAIGFLTSPAQATALNQPISRVAPLEYAISQNVQPQQIAQVSGCPRAEMVESFATANFSVYICKTQQGDLFYRGVSKKSGNQINVMQVTTGDDGTYYATNRNIIYSINPKRLQVKENGKVILTEAVIK